MQQGVSPFKFTVQRNISFLSFSLSPHMQMYTVHICLYKKITNLGLSALSVTILELATFLGTLVFMRNEKQWLSVCLPSVTHSIIGFPPSFCVLSFLFQTAKSGFKQFLIQQLFLNFLQEHPVAFYCVSLLLLHHLKQNKSCILQLLNVDVSFPYDSAFFNDF